MSQNIWVLGEALMDCVAQSDGSLRPLMGGSPFNMARAAALRGAKVGFLNPLSVDLFGQQMRAQFEADGVEPLSPPSLLPTSLAVVQINRGQPSYRNLRPKRPIISWESDLSHVSCLYRPRLK